MDMLGKDGNSDVGTEVVANVTCPVCLNLFTDPKMMPNCLHTFCLECLKMVPITKGSSSWKIPCPECRTVSRMTGPKSSRTIESFKSNIVAKNVVDIIRAQHKANGITSSCPHVLSTETQEKCDHCSRAFCYPCRLVHMEELKTESLEHAAQVVDKCLSISVDDAMSQIDRYVESEAANVEMKLQAAVDTAKASFEAYIAKQVETVKAQLSTLKTEHSDLLKSKLGGLVDLERISTLKVLGEAIGSSSILKQNLADVAKFHIDISERHRSVNYLEAAFRLDPPALFKFEIGTGLQSVLLNMDSLKLASLDLNKEAKDLASPICQPVPENIRKLPKKLLEGPPEKMEVEGAAAGPAVISSDSDGEIRTGSGQRQRRRRRVRVYDSDKDEDDTSEESSSEATASSSSEESDVEDEGEDEEDEEEEEEEEEDEEEEDHEEENDNESYESGGSQAVEVNNEEDELVIDSCVKESKQLYLKEAHAVIALPSKNAFGIMQASKMFNLVHPRTGIVTRQYEILCPVDVNSIEIFDLAVADRDCIFLTSEVEYGENWTKTRRIYRFWLDSPHDVIELNLFAKAKNDNDFRGIAISKELRYVFTTEGESIIALASTSNSRSQLGTRVFQCRLGQDPFVYAVYQTSATKTEVICSSENNLLDKVIVTMPDGHCELKREKRWRDTELEDLRMAWPHLVALWDGNILVSKGYWLKRFTSFPRFPEFVGAFAPAYSSAHPLEGCTGLAVIKSGSGSSEKDVVALINSSGFVTLANLPANGSLVYVAEQL